ncbi:MAG TPA: hypothetical protein PKX48_12380 [Planctomycetota bacterium]|jgi:hypothetical protein|nr:hypothetical protein [Planctomycetota bacterium]OQC22182.1 MAG: hypothetical protein BWX69_00033 [Planctomycetes bacterium ADurb.Bin069]HNR99746.1 hypothetical protein [Planctomycetota bacterium]HNU25365.1 hypothetical protein [Planctomycetota bacterium]HOE29366.1 hypothetical protein [Planctomycetota bacterium]
MRRGLHFGHILLAVALFAPPVFNLALELRRLKAAPPAPPRADFHFGEAPFAPEPPKRGRYIPARIVDFRSPSPLRSTFMVHFPPTEEVHRGAVVIGPHAILAGTVAKVWQRQGVALVRSVEDPGFRALCASRDGDIVLVGRGESTGLSALAGTLDVFADGERVVTAARSRVFPAGLVLGNRRGNTVVPAFAYDRDRWVYLWHDPDLQALSAALGIAFQ